MTREPFINTRTLAVHFPDDQEESNDGTGNVVRHLDRDSDSIQPVTRFDFIESTPFRQLELIAAELEKLRDWAAEREMELERAIVEMSNDPHRKVSPVPLALANAFSLSANELEGVAQKIRDAISECYAYWSRQQDADERAYDRIGD